MPLIFITRLLLMCLFYFHAFRENFNKDDEKGSHMPFLRESIYRYVINCSIFSTVKLREENKDILSYLKNCKRIFPPSPMTPIFILRLLLRRSFSLRALSDSVYFHFPYSPIAPIKKEDAERNDVF